MDNSQELLREIRAELVRTRSDIHADIVRACSDIRTELTNARLDAFVRRMLWFYALVIIGLIIASNFAEHVGRAS